MSVHTGYVTHSVVYANSHSVIWQPPNFLAFPSPIEGQIREF